jgi:class 3 adenylate cyclase
VKHLHSRPGFGRAPMADIVAATIFPHRLPSRRATEAERVLATVLFTDIVGSTELLVRRGDTDWRRVLHRHHTAARHEVERHRGRLIKTTGDGVLATFDGPGRAIRSAGAIRDSVRALGSRSAVDSTPARWRSWATTSGASPSISPPG